MAENKQMCSLLLINNDMEWMHAFQKGVQRFFLTAEKTVQTLEDAEAVLQNYAPDLIVLSAYGDLPPMDKLKQLLHRLGRSIPVLVVAADLAEGSDVYVRQGAEFVSARRDLLTAIRAVQHVMRLSGFENMTKAAEAHLQGVEIRYQRLFQDLPDPLCYLQDGLFLDANPAFLRAFKIRDHAELEELTIMNFVSLKSERALKQLMKLALEKDVVPVEQVDFNTRDGEKLEMNVQVTQVQFRGETAVQMYLRDALSSGGGGAGGTDSSTGLPYGNILKASIRQTQERSDQDVLGTWIYLWLENYREVLHKDGYRAAEILIRSVSDAAERLLPPSTEMARFTDDALLLWVAGDKEQTIVRIQNLVTHLDDVVPENIGRLIHPRTFAGMLEVRKDSVYEDLISRSYRAVRSLAAGQSRERVAEPAGANMSRKDERRINLINKMLEEGRIIFRYQPISTLDADGVPRYADRIKILPGEDEMEEDIELDVLLQLSDRYKLMRRIDRLKITQFIQEILSYSGADQKNITGYLSLATDTLADETFPEWIAAQFDQTGIAPRQLVFDFRLDVANNGFTGASRLIENLRPLGVRFAVSEIGRFDEGVTEILTRIKPDILKLDMREIDTFEDEEEQRFMAAVKEYAEANQVELIADHMESPAQLSRVWPYDIKLLQGDGMVAPMNSFQFDFSEPLF